MPRHYITLARALLLVAALTGAWATVRAGLAAALKDGAPQLAARIDPTNARVAVAALRASAADPARLRSPAARARVRRALARDLTVPGAIELRAVQAELDGQPGRAARLFALADRVSRRSLPTRLWLIQRSVDRGDVGGALRHFDIALRTSTDAPPILFPVLANAAGDPALVRPIAAMLDRPSDWRAMFLHYAVSESPAYRNLVAVLGAMRDREAVRSGGFDQLLVGRLVAGHDYAAARRLADAFAPADRRADDLRFAGQRPPPFGWHWIQGGARSAEPGGAMLSFRAEAGASGPVATRLLTLPPGQYRLASGSGGGSGGAAAWSLTCGGKTPRQVAVLAVPSRGLAARTVTIPANCGGQWLTLNIGSNDDRAQTGLVRFVSLEPLQPDTVSMR